MKAMGKKMMTRESVVAITARPISRVASMAAVLRSTPFSSMKRTMFSRTMMASSMTMPTASVSASRVILLSEKSICFMSVKVAMMEERIYGGFDEVGNIVDDEELHAGRHLRAQIFDLGFDVFGDLHGVDAGLAAHVDGDNVLTGTFPAEERGPGEQFLCAVFDLRNVAHAHERGAARAYDDFAELLRGIDAAHGAQAELLRAGNHAAAGGFDVFAL